MPNDQKKKKNKQELLEAWTDLKEHIIRLVKGGIVYREYKAPESITKRELLQRKLQANEGYESQLRIEQQKYIRLESKLEKVRDLVSQEQFSKLKKLITEGKI